jgi:hypothetical protein
VLGSMDQKLPEPMFRLRIKSKQPSTMTDEFTKMERRPGTIAVMATFLFFAGGVAPHWSVL